uniref:Uncharacterized protein n=1 Tax=Trichogramma kaykai TaxID=54128 RepID=A0ABD2XQD5_9HYME
MKSLRRNVDWKIEEERRKLLNRLYPLVKVWTDQLPNLRDIFRAEEIDWLLTEDVRTNLKFRRGNLIKFAIKTNYNDEPEFDEDGRPLLRRTTPIHIAARINDFRIVHDLFKIYNKFHANYVDELGMTHFHAACKYGCYEVVEIFLKLGQNPNCLPPPLNLALDGYCFNVANLLLDRGADPNLPDEEGTTPLHVACKDYDTTEMVQKFIELNVRVDALDNRGRTPLHYAAYVESGHQMNLEVLLRNGANPNLADVEGLTPLHIICQRIWEDDDTVELFFKICDEKNQTVQLDAKDKKGRTPLYHAVTSLLTNSIDPLLNRGANLSNFIFPTESDFDERFKEWSGYDYYNYYDCKLKLASGVLRIIEQLEKRGYELDQSDVLTVMKLFAKYELFQKSQDIEKVLNDDEEFAANAKKIFILPEGEDTDDSEDEKQFEEVVRKTEDLPVGQSLTLYDLVRLQPEQAQKQLTYSDYNNFWKCRKLCYLSENHCREACEIHLCEKLSKRFFRRWAIYPFWELIHHRLPLECCEMIIQHLRNEDLYNIILVVTGQSQDSK